MNMQIKNCNQWRGAFVLGVLSAAAAYACTPVVFAEDVAGKLQYNRDIRPILADNCFACHGPDSAARKADLRLDKRDQAMSSSAIAPGKPEASELVNRILSDDEALLMPPPETK